MKPQPASAETTPIDPESPLGREVARALTIAVEEELDRRSKAEARKSGEAA